MWWRLTRLSKYSDLRDRRSLEVDLDLGRIPPPLSRASVGPGHVGRPSWIFDLRISVRRVPDL